MSVQQPSVPAAQPFRRLRWIVLGSALLAGIGAGMMIAMLESSSPPATAFPVGPMDPGIRWAAGKRAAPAFSLRNQNGGPISLREFDGRPVIVTFIDPVCRNLCPLEAKVLGRVVLSFPVAERPAIVAVSVNQWGNTRRNLLLDKTKWSLPSQWHWAVGAPAALARVWNDYAIGVSAATKTIAGITVHRITHTEAAYVLDGRGYERALFVYPFSAQDVENALRSLGRS